MAVVLIKEGQPDQIECFGYRDVDKQLPITPDTLFCIASCSKSMTVALIARLVDEGKLDWDVPVTQYVPYFRMWDEEADRNMTLRDLLCHRTGLAPHDALWPGTATREELMKRIRYLKPIHKFREVSEYNNLLYAMVGHVAEYVTGERWPQLMAKYIFEPLSMNRTGCLAKEITLDSDHAEPYRIDQGMQKQIPFWNVDLAGPAASINSTAADMAKWIHFQMERGRTADGKQLISSETFAEMHKPHMKIKDGAGAAGGGFPAHSYCLGWRAGDFRGHPMEKHSGKIEGYSTFQAFLPEEKIAVIILTNFHEPSTPIFYSTLYTLLDQALGYEDVHWEKNFRDENAHPVESVYHDCEEDLTAGRLDEDIKGEEATVCWSKLIGVYQNPGYGRVTVNLTTEEEETKLMLHYRDQNLPLHHWGKNQYWMDGVREDINLFKMPVTFIIEDDNVVAGVNISYEPMVEDICFKKEH